MAKIGTLKAKVGSYQKDGQTKNKYADVGVLMSGNDGGFYVLMNTTFNPAGVPNPEGKESIMVSVFMDDQQQPQQTQGNQYIPQQQAPQQQHTQYQPQQMQQAQQPEPIPIHDDQQQIPF